MKTQYSGQELMDALKNKIFENTTTILALVKEGTGDTIKICPSRNCLNWTTIRHDVIKQAAYITDYSCPNGDSYPLFALQLTIDEGNSLAVALAKVLKSTAYQGFESASTPSFGSSQAFQDLSGVGGFTNNCGSYVRPGAFASHRHPQALANYVATCTFNCSGGTSITTSGSGTTPAAARTNAENNAILQGCSIVGYGSCTITQRMAAEAEGYCPYSASHYTGVGTQMCTSPQCTRFADHTGAHQCFYGHSFY